MHTYALTINSTPVHSRGKETQVYKKACTKTCRALLVIITPNWKPSKHLLTEGWVNKCAKSHNGILVGNENEWIAYTWDNKGDSQEHAEQKKPNTKEHARYDYVERKFKNGQSQPLVTEIRTVIVDDGGRGGLEWLTALGAQKSFLEWWACSLVFLMGVVITQVYTFTRTRWIVNSRSVPLTVGKFDFKRTKQSNTVRGMKGSKLCCLWLSTR